MKWLLLIPVIFILGFVFSVVQDAQEWHNTVQTEVSVTEHQIDMAEYWFKNDPENPMLQCGSGFTCVIHSNLGGRTVAFLAGVYELKQIKGMIVVIDGPCVSACATFAAYGRPQTCVTPYTSFGFHKGSTGGDQPLPDDIRGWVLKHGGFPAYESGSITWMQVNDAEMFWRRCW